MWQWLTNSDNQKILAFLGGGAASVITAAWAVFKYHYKPSHKKGAGSVKVKADRGGIAAGRDVRDVNTASRKTKQ